ncbi:MAG: PhoH family protein [Acidobacteriota bacterium]
MAGLAADPEPSTLSQATKVFVLDTSVILYDHNALDSFEEHDVAIPLTVLEELDRFKKGNSVLNRNAREFIRRLDEFAGDNLLREWIPLNGTTRGSVKVIVPDPETTSGAKGGSGKGPGSNGHSARSLFGADNDHRILDSALALQHQVGERRVVLVSKDINLRLKARALELPAEDYKHIKIEDIESLYRGRSDVALEDPSILGRLHSEGTVGWEEIFSEKPPANHFFILSGQQGSALARFDPRRDCIERIVKEPAYGITPRNAEQTFALQALRNEDIPLITLTGPAGTGKTLIALAGALEQSRKFRQVFLARPIVPLSNRDLGYLPGDVQSKITPYMQPLWDNLRFIKSQFDSASRAFKRLDEMVESEKIEVIPLAYIRGRSFSRSLFIVDEAQNLTPHEVKTIITRAGEGTKIVLTGDIFQIDTPYLDARSNGLSYLIDRLKGNPLYAHVNLDKGERSELANLASELL